MARLPSTYLRRNSVENPNYGPHGINGHIPQKFHMGEVLKEAVPHYDHGGDMKVVELVTSWQAIAMCTTPGCSAECLITGVLSEM